MQLREYQEIQNQKVRESIATHRRVISCMSTGAGKSVMMADLTKRALDKGNSVVVVLPRRSLVTQLSESFHNYGINHGVVMAGVRPYSLPRVQIVSIDTYKSRMAKGVLKIIEADLLIIDEVHMQFTKKNLDIFEHYRYVVGFTATPVAPRGQSLGGFYKDIIETISFKELVKAKFLSPIRYFADPNIDLSKVRTDRTGDWRESDLDKEMDKPKLIGDIYDNWERIAAGKPTVVFASSQSHARHLCQVFVDNGYQFEYMDCLTPDDERQDIFNRVRSGQTIGICNVGIVSVGIDIPNLEVCVLARPTKLISIYLQCVGRITRLHKGKKFGYVIDHAGIIERLGFADDDIPWSLDGKETVEERLIAKKKEKKEPKEIICGKCHYVFTSSKHCPQCGHEMIHKDKAVPTHKMDLKEIKRDKKAESVAESNNFYAEILGYAMTNGKNRKYALAMYKERYGSWPPKHIAPKFETSPETLKYIKYKQIKYAKSKQKREYTALRTYGALDKRFTELLNTTDNTER